MCKQKRCRVSKKKYRNKIPRKTFSDKQNRTKLNKTKIEFINLLLGMRLGFKSDVATQ